MVPAGKAWDRIVIAAARGARVGAIIAIGEA